jgi:hypothetical protein
MVTCLIDCALCLIDYFVRFFNSLLYEMLNWCLIPKLFVNLAYINFCRQISVCCILFCFPYCLSSWLCIIFQTEITPCLLKWIIRVVFRWLSWWFRGLSFFDWLLLNLWLCLFLNYSFLSFKWTGCMRIFHFSLLDIMLSDIVDCISFRKIASRSRSLNLAW